MRSFLFRTFVMFFVLGFGLSLKPAHAEIFSNGFEDGDVPPPKAIAINDTGITQCGDFPFDATGQRVSGHTISNKLSCSDSTDAEGDAIPFGQDGHYGTGKNGSHGLTLTKLDAEGQPLPDGAASWSCVKDEHTGLIWEVKSASNGTKGDGGLHDADDTFSWFNTNAAQNGGSEGFANTGGATCFGHAANQSASHCNTEAFVNRVNAEKLCGFNNWRVPTREELRSILNLSTFNPAIETTYFPNAVNTFHWTWTTDAQFSTHAWVVNFSHGYDNWGKKDKSLPVRLVRPAK